MAPEPYADVRAGVAKLCAGFPGEYWRRLDAERGCPAAFVEALTASGYLADLIPEDYGGAGLPLSGAAAILEKVQRQGCNGAARHAQPDVMGTVPRHGSEAQKRRYLPEIAAGLLRLRAFAAGDACIQTFGGFGFEEYGAERNFRETRPYQVAPVSTAMILGHVAEHVLGLPRSH